MIKSLKALFWLPTVLPLKLQIARRKKIKAKLIAQLRKHGGDPKDLGIED